MDTKDLPPTLTVEQAGQLLGISRHSAYRAAARGELPTIKLGRRVLIPTARLLAQLGMSARAGRLRGAPPTEDPQ